MKQQATTLKRLLRGVLEPTVAYLMMRNWIKMLKQRRFNALYGSIFETLLTPGSNPYFNRLADQSDDGLVLSDVLGFQMYLDVDDPGLSRTLLQFGIREEVSTRVFTAELQRLMEDVEGEITVLEIGANLGYFTLIEATTLGERGRIHAIEPVPRNLEILRKNIALNNIADSVHVHELALGNRNTKAQFHLAEKSNWHSFHQTGDHHDSVGMDMVTTDQFIAQHGVDYDAVHVVRTDLEGFEVELFEGMEKVLAAETPLLLYIELHPSLRDSDELNQVVDRLDEFDFDIVSTTLDVYGGRFDHGWFESPVQFDSFEEIKRHQIESDAAVLLIARKN